MNAAPEGPSSSAQSDRGTRARSSLRIQTWHFPLLAVLVAITFFFLDHAYGRATTELTLRQADAAQELAVAYIAHLGPVALRSTGIFAGAERLEGSTEVVEAVKGATGLGCALYRGKQRIAVTHGSSGAPDATPERADATELALSGATFRGVVEDNDKAYYLVEHPFRDASGHVVGHIATYTDRDDFERGLLTFRLVLGGALLVLTGLLFLLVQRVQQQERHLSDLREAEAREQARVRNEFFAGMSHELRTPLSAVLGFAASLREQPTDASGVTDLAGRIEHVSRDLLAIINNILDAAKLESGHVELLLEPVDVGAAIARVAQKCEVLTRDKPVFIVVDVPRDLPMVRADFVKVQQVLVNLVGNAVKFTERGEVRLGARAVNREVVIEVTDTGVGIAPEALGSIWTPFRQADGSIARRFGGTGLGLSLARGLVDLMGGAIEVRSTLGAGTTFTVRLPVAIV